MSRLGPQPNFYPTPLLSDIQWERVVRALALQRTKIDNAILERLDRQLQLKRLEKLEREAPVAPPEEQ